MAQRTIRHATQEDMPRILELIECGRQKMRAVGNTEQWTNGDPQREVLMHDIEQGNSYLVEDAGVAVATFAFVEGPDVTYEHIYEGSWLDETDDFGQKGPKTIKNDYYVIHRMASIPEVHGIMKTVLDFAFSKTSNLRIDTHRQNIIMRRVLEKFGFCYCGIIYLLDGAERQAFQKIISPSTHSAQCL